MIHVDRVTKRYGGAAAVDDVSLHLPEGGVTSIIGPNGAGKSTLLALISRLQAPDEGRITVAGMDVSSARGRDLARRLAVLRQENHVAARLTVSDLVAFGRFPHSRTRPTAEDRDHVDRAIGYLHLGELRDRFIDELSGGQRQRAFVAMVLCQDADCVLLDEPLNNLDIRHAVEIMRLLRRAADELGKTVVMVIHDINFASCHSDRVVAMRGGRIAVDGAPADVMRPEVLAAVYDVDVDVHVLGGRHIGVYFT